MAAIPTCVFSKIGPVIEDNLRIFETVRRCSHFSYCKSLSSNQFASTTKKAFFKAQSPAFIVKASDDNNSTSKGLFNFVTDNESSRNAIQLETNNVTEGNVGQMITQIENKGRDSGGYIESGEFTYFLREIPPSGEFNENLDAPVVVLLHGAPTQSWSYMALMKQLSEKGFHCYAFDFLGFGFSEKPQPGYGFKYTEAEYHKEITALLESVEIKKPFNLLVQGFILGSYGLTWALANPDKISNLAILNTQLTAASGLPGIFNQLRLPFVGEFVSQNAILPERFVEGGSPYVLDNDDADVFRLPYLDSSEPGFALLEAARKFPAKDIQARIASGFSAGRWSVPTTVAWGEKDKYLATTEATEFASRNPEFIKAKILDGAGHLPQMDWPEKVVDAVIAGFRKQ